MTQTPTQTQIVETDHKLSTAVDKAEKNAATAQLKLDIHRYAWTTHPSTPTSLRMTLTDYADLVGVNRSTVKRSVDAVEQSIKSGVVRTDNIKVPREQARSGSLRSKASDETDDDDETEVDDDQAEAHKGSRVQSKHGDEKTIVIEALAAAFGKSIATVSSGSQKVWRDRLADAEARTRANAASAGKATIRKVDAVQAAKEIRAEHDAVQTRLANIKTAMLAARKGLKLSVTDIMVADLYDRAVKLAARGGLDLDEAIADRLDFDGKAMSAERDEAERRSKRGRYVMEIEQGLATMLAGGTQVEKAMREAKGDLDLTDDEIEDFSALVRRIRGSLSAVDMLITGDGDWDSALTGLIAGSA